MNASSAALAIASAFDPIVISNSRPTPTAYVPTLLWSSTESSPSSNISPSIATCLSALDAISILIPAFIDSGLALYASLIIVRLSRLSISRRPDEKCVLAKAKIASFGLIPSLVPAATASAALPRLCDPTTGMVSSNVPS